MSREIIDEAKRLLAALDEDTSRTAQLRVLSHALAEARSKPRDWLAFWSSLTDAEAAACLRAAPRVAGEWEDASDHGEPYRVRRWVGHRVEACRYWSLDEGGWAWGSRTVADECDTEEEARAACDSALRASGWRVL